MKLFLASAFASLLILAGCRGESEDTYSGDEATDASASNAAAMLRPDALNPANENLEVPVGWKFRFDDATADVSVGADADSSDVFFVTMKPGWHVTTHGSSGIFWHPASTARGSYTASAGIYLFPPGRMNEGYGLIIGGRDLDGPNQTYIYFLIRRSGEYLVKRRAGEETETLVGWESSDAIVPYTDTTEGTTLNKLAVMVDASTLTFLVNDQVVHSMPKGDLVTDGIVGLRLNHGLNMHIESFDVVPEV